MRLLERNAAGEIHLTRDFLDHEIPRYAILSHTWGPEEVLFQDLTDGTGEARLGYEKIRFCGDQAWRDGLEFCWVDTCCIDKPNNTELQEAINSMFRWYRDAARCYVYLADVSTPTGDAIDKPSWQPAFRKSRWFTRGWTLQELIAPVSVEFFSREGVRLGTRKSLEHDIHHITGLPLTVLRGNPLPSFSISERLAWIEKRVTTRKEDKAYSLLGLFDIHMPLIYGEGETNAFKRLRKKIGGIGKVELPLIPIANDATFDSRAEEHNARCHPDTRIDLLHQIRAWVDDPNGECIFWLNGRAGTGKSTISRTVASQFKEQGVLGASFLFKRGERDRGNASFLFTTIAVQLVTQEPQLSSFLRAAIDFDPAISTKALKEQFEKLILEPLRRVHSGSQDPCTIAIVIDALDECDNDDDIKLVIYLFSQAKTLSSVRLKIFITSRPELPIRLGFKDITGKYQDVALHQIPEPVIEQDISAYLRYELARIRENYNSQAFDNQQLPPQWPGQHLQTLVRMAVPLFIFAATVCRFIADETWEDPERQLSKILDFRSTNSKLDNLDSTYLPVLDQLVAGKTGATRHRLVSEFREIVGPVVLLAEPLSVSALSHLLGIPGITFTRTLSRLHAALEVPSRVESPIRLFHLSFRDFLIDPARRNANEFWIDETKTHRKLASLCIQRLQSHLKRDVCSLRKPGKARIEVDEKDINKCLPAHIQYACRYWVSHLTQSKAFIRDGDHVNTFLHYHFLHWLEALSLIGKVAESVTMVTALQALVEPQSVQMSAFLADAQRFIASCISYINITPLQIYSSAVLFAPKCSIFHLISHIPVWIATKPCVEQDWSLCRQTLEGHQYPVISIAFSYDGRTLASASKDETVKLWDTATGRCRQTLEGHQGSVHSIAFSHDSSTLVSIYSCRDIISNKTIKLWDTVTGQCRQTLDRVYRVAFSPGSGTLASVSDGKTIKLWDIVTGHCSQTLQGHQEWIKSIAISYDGRTLASASEDKTIRLWDTVTGQCRQVLEEHQDSVSSVAFSHDGSTLASVYYVSVYSDKSDHNTIKLWDTVTGHCSQTLKGENEVRIVAFSYDGRTLASVSENITIQLWDTATGQCRQTLQGHRWWIGSIAFSYDSGTLASVSNDMTTKLWHIATGKCYQTLEGHQGAVSSVAFLRDGSTLASASWDKTIKLWDIAKGTYRQTLERHQDCVDSVAFSPNSTTLVSISKDNSIKLWDTATGQCRQTLDRVYRVAFSPSSGTLASVSDDKTIKLWDIVTGHCSQTLKGENEVHIVAFSYDGRTLASVSENITIQLWDTATGQCRQTLQGHQDLVCRVAFSHDSGTLASVSLDSTIKLWDIATGNCCRTLEGHRGRMSGFRRGDPPVYLVTFSRDGGTLASDYYDTSEYKALKLWDTATGQCRLILRGHRGRVLSIAFSQDGGTLASASADETIKLWDTAKGTCRQTIKIGKKLRTISFDSTDSYIHTEIGNIRLNTTLQSPNLPPVSLPFQPSQQPYYEGYGISSDGTWITWNSERLVWLPQEYRPRSSAVQGSAVALGCPLGQVLILQFSTDPPVCI